MTDGRPLALVIGPPQRTGDLVAELRDGIGERARIVTAADTQEGLVAAADPVALALVDCRDAPVDTIVSSLKARPQFADTRILAVVGADVEGTPTSLDRGWIDAFIGMPLTPGVLAWHAGRQLERWLVRQGPETGPPSSARGVEPGSELLKSFGAPEGALSSQLVASIERALGPRPRLHLPAGVRLTRQDHHIDGLYVVLEGEVALTRRDGRETMLFHHDSTGRVVGLLSLVNRATSHFTSTTTTPAVVVHLSTDQLDHAMQVEPAVPVILAATAVTQLGVRLVRSGELQIERNSLIHKLEEERAELAETLRQLQDARLELVAQARFATLGEMSAGIAHELNNPVAALVRSTEHLLQDVTDLLSGQPRGELIANTMRASAAREAISTREERAVRRELTAVTRDAALARRLVAAGITDPVVAKVAAKDRTLAGLVEVSAKLGTSLRSIGLSAGHITRLVTSLRSYARPDTPPVDGVDINTSLDDTLQLVSHRLGEVKVVRDYGEISQIRARPAQLGQVWMNVLVNAAEALRGSGVVTVRTRDRGDFVVAELIDDGPGIPADILDRVFEPRFTTKHGTVRFGLGMGLGIVSRFVQDHGGTIDIESEPGRTCVRVQLPVTGPPESVPATPARREEP